MTDITPLIKKYLPEVKIMQLATSLNNQPWVFNVHFYSDDKFNLYWISTKEREHSKHIEENPNTAATILIHENTEEEPYVIGISIAGKAELIGEHIDEEISNAYIQKHNKPATLLSDIASGINPHKFYRLTPSKIVLFDSKTFPDNPRQELNLA